jgi:hypothetical protein
MGHQLFIQRNPKEDFVMSIVPPASATLIWAFPTEYEEVRCFVWEHSPAGWSIAIMFGDETLALEVAPTRWAMESGVDMVWRGLLASGIGKLAGGSKALTAMSAAAPRTDAPPISSGDELARRREMSEMARIPASIRRPAPMPMPRPIPRGTVPRRFEDPFGPHTPFRHQEPSFDVDSEEPDPSPRRRPH